MLGVGTGIIGVGLPISRERQKLRPVDVRIPWERGRDRKGLSEVRACLPVDERRAKQRRKGAGVVQGVGCSCEVESVRTLDVGVVGPKTRPDAALADIAQ